MWSISKDVESVTPKSVGSPRSSGGHFDAIVSCWVRAASERSTLLSALLVLIDQLPMGRVWRSPGAHRALLKHGYSEHAPGRPSRQSWRGITTAFRSIYRPPHECLEAVPSRCRPQCRIFRRRVRWCRPPAAGPAVAVQTTWCCARTRRRIHSMSIAEALKGESNDMGIQRH